MELGDLSSGVFALLGAVVGGAFTARAATSAARLQARADAFELWTQVRLLWIALNSDPQWLDHAGATRDFHQAQRRVMFLAGVPLDTYDAVRASQLVLSSYWGRGEDPPVAAWEYASWSVALVEEYLEHPWRARLRNRSLRIWRVRRRWRKDLLGGEVPAV